MEFKPCHHKSMITAFEVTDAPSRMLKLLQLLTLESSFFNFANILQEHDIQNYKESYREIRMGQEWEIFKSAETGSVEIQWDSPGSRLDSRD